MVFQAFTSFLTSVEQSIVGTIQICCVEEHVYDGNEGTGKITKSFFLDEVLCVVSCGVVAGSRRSTTSYDS